MTEPKPPRTNEEWATIFPAEAVKIAQEPRADFDTMVERHRRFMVRGSEL